MALSLWLSTFWVFHHFVCLLILLLFYLLSLQCTDSQASHPSISLCPFNFTHTSWSLVAKHTKPVDLSDELLRPVSTRFWRSFTTSFAQRLELLTFVPDYTILACYGINHKQINFQPSLGICRYSSTESLVRHYLFRTDTKYAVFWLRFITDSWPKVSYLHTKYNLAVVRGM